MTARVRFIAKELVMQLTGWSERSFYRWASDNKAASRNRIVGANGKPIREYPLHLLPIDAQKKALSSQLFEACSDEAALVLPESVQPTFSFPTTSALQEYRDRSVILDPKRDKQAQERFRAVEALSELKNRGRGPSGAYITLANGTRIRTNMELEHYVAEQHGMTRPTLLKWVVRLRMRGFAGLADDAHGPSKGFKSYFDDKPDLRSFAEKKYLSERLSIRTIHEALERECMRRGTDAPCYDSVRLYLKSLPKVLEIISREGERQYHDRCEMYLVKGYSDKLANDIWVSDHMQHDVFVRNDGFFPDEADGTPLRPWLTAIIDYRTRKVLGWTWSVNPSSESIASAMRMALVQFGKPQETFYVDNGKDFKSLGKINLISPELSGTLERLGITSQYCQPRHPQSKHIERWFRTLHERFDVLWRPFYSGRSPKGRPEECDKMLAEHRKLLKKGQPDCSPLQPASEFVQAAEYWIRQYNARHRHTGEGMDGKTPDELFNAQYPIEQRRLLIPDELRALDVLLRRREKRRVREGGCIFLGSHRYEPADPASAAAMMLEIEHDVIVACDPANMGEAVACDLDGHYLATLQASKLLEHGPVSRDEIRASMRQRHMVKRAMKDYVSGLVAASYARGEESELELLRKKAGIDRPVRIQKRHALAAATLPKQPYAPSSYEDVVRHFKEAD